MKDEKVIEEVAVSGQVDQGVVKTNIKKELDEGFTNIAVAIDEYFNLTKEPLSQYQREVNNEKDIDKSLAIHQLKTVLNMKESVLVERFLKEDRPLVEFAPALAATKLVEEKRTDDLDSHLAGKVFTEMVFANVIEPTEEMFGKVSSAVTNVTPEKFTVEAILQEMLECGDI